MWALSRFSADSSDRDRNCVNAREECGSLPWSTSIVFVSAHMAPENIALMEAEAMGDTVKEVSELLRGHLLQPRA